MARAVSQPCTKKQKTFLFDYFRETLLPINTVYIHAKDVQLNTTNGFNEKVTILSVKIDREKLNSLNFETIDCSDSMANFEHNMKFRKTKGFAPVETLTPNEVN